MVYSSFKWSHNWWNGPSFELLKFVQLIGKPLLWLERADSNLERLLRRERVALGSPQLDEELRVVEPPDERAPSLRGWHFAFVIGLLLALAAVVLALLAVTGAVHVP